MSRVFFEISVKECLYFMYQHCLCYNCKKAGHISKYCYSEAACTKNDCKQKHHLLLHQERCDISPTSNTKLHSTNFLAASNITVGSNVFLNVVPVYVKTGLKPVLTCAFFRPWFHDFSLCLSSFKPFRYFRRTNQILCHYCY